MPKFRLVPVSFVGWDERLPLETINTDTHASEVVERVEVPRRWDATGCSAAASKTALRAYHA